MLLDSSVGHSTAWLQDVAAGDMDSDFKNATSKAWQTTSIAMHTAVQHGVPQASVMPVEPAAKGPWVYLEDHTVFHAARVDQGNGSACFGPCSAIAAGMAHHRNSNCMLLQHASSQAMLLALTAAAAGPFSASTTVPKNPPIIPAAGEADGFWQGFSVGNREGMVPGGFSSTGFIAELQPGSTCAAPNLLAAADIRTDEGARGGSKSSGGNDNASASKRIYCTAVASAAAAAAAAGVCRNAAEDSARESAAAQYHTANDKPSRSERRVRQRLQKDVDQLTQQVRWGYGRRFNMCLGSLSMGRNALPQ